MSRQFDQYMEDKFEYQGELKSLIYPTSFSELVSALEIRDTLLKRSINESIEARELARKVRAEVFTL